MTEICLIREESCFISDLGHIGNMKT